MKSDANVSDVVYQVKSGANVSGVVYQVKSDDNVSGEMYQVKSDDIDSPANEEHARGLHALLHASCSDSGFGLDFTFPVPPLNSQLSRS